MENTYAGKGRRGGSLTTGGRSLDSITNQEERESLWKNYLREADQWEEECWRLIHSERQQLYNKRKDR